MSGLDHMKRAPKSARSKMDTVLFTQEDVKALQLPPIQRPLRVNAKVLGLAEELKGNGGVISGVITLGTLGAKRYLLDGQHRIEAFKISGLKECIADVREVEFDSMADMGEEFDKTNSRLVNLRPDDRLRALELSIPALKKIKSACQFVGYDNIRRGGASPVVSMSALLRSWHSSSPPVPANSSQAAADVARTLTDDDVHMIGQYLTLAGEAWGLDPEYYRLWGNLNVTLTMWLFRRTVISQYSSKAHRIKPEEFKRCLMSLSANSDYLEWLVGRNLGERDRSPCYGRIKNLFAKRLTEMWGGKKAVLPAPEWATALSSLRAINAKAVA